MLGTERRSSGRASTLNCQAVSPGLSFPKGRHFIFHISHFADCLFLGFVKGMACNLKLSDAAEPCVWTDKLLSVMLRVLCSKGNWQSPGINAEMRNS